MVEGDQPQGMWLPLAGTPQPTPDATAVQLVCQGSLRLWLLPLEQAVGTQEMAGPLFPLGERLG